MRYYVSWKTTAYYRKDSLKLVARCPVSGCWPSCYALLCLLVLLAAWPIVCFRTVLGLPPVFQNNCCVSHAASSCARRGCRSERRNQLTLALCATGFELTQVECMFFDARKSSTRSEWVCLNTVNHCKSQFTANQVEVTSTMPQQVTANQYEHRKSPQNTANHTK